MYSIYKYTNSVNGKVYIGQTSKSLAERAQANGRNYRECRRFYNAILKYSWHSFVPEVLAVVDTVETANELEQYYIALYHSTDDRYGYNIALGGDNKEMSETTRKIISEKAKARYVDKTANPMYGKRHSLESICKQRAKKLDANNPMYGTVWTDTQRERSGTRGKHLNLTDEQRAVLRQRAATVGKTIGLRSVRCVEDNTVYSSIQEAASAYRVSKGTICGHLRGSQKTCCGKHFEYVN